MSLHWSSRWPTWLVLLAVMAPLPAVAVQIEIVGYDVTHATAASAFNWDHVYTGTETVVSGNIVNQTGGGGILNDGVKVGTTQFNTQLFCGTATGCTGIGQNFDEAITIYFDGLYAIDQIDLYGGDHGNNGNTIPGAINLVDLTISATTQTFVTTGFGPTGSHGGVNDRILLTGSPLEGFFVDQITLLNFRTTELSFGDRFSLAEIEVFGTLVPEPGTASLLGLGLVVLSACGRFRGAKTGGAAN